MKQSTDGAVIWRPIGERGHLYERIVAQVEELIDSKSLHPGDRLPPERELAIFLRVSRPSVREALKILEARGRLCVRHGQGVFIADGLGTADEMSSLLTSKKLSLQEIFAMREV